MKQKKFFRCGCILLAVLSGFNLLNCLAAFLVRNILGGISFSVNRAATIGIIGGSDGPTAVFVTAAPIRGWESILWLALLAASIYGLSRFRKDK